MESRVPPAPPLDPPLHHPASPQCTSIFNKESQIDVVMLSSSDGQTKLRQMTAFSLKVLKVTRPHLPDSQARCSRGRRPSLAESVLSSTYWGREDDLDIEYSLIFQPNASPMLAHCLRHWLNINPTLPHVTSRVW